MSTTTTQTSTKAPSKRLVLNISASSDINERLSKNGFAVVPSVFSEEKALEYADRAYTWVESFGCGFNRNDPSTYSADKMPFFVKGGLMNRYGVAHEQWMWDLKSEPSIVDVFSQIWGTDELLASFDGCNISIPFADRLPDDAVFTPWPHVDQSPLVKDLYCVQGIMNLLPNGPDDGGLMVLKGSSALYTEMFEAFEDKKPAEGWNVIDSHNHTPEQIQWFLDHGCEWEKVCAGPGDLLLWDSRTVHYGATPSAQAHRLAVYCCYKPAAMADEKVMAIRRNAWEKKLNTSHDPISSIMGRRWVPDDHHTAKMEIPLQNPVLTPLGRKLVGVV